MEGTNRHDASQEHVSQESTSRLSIAQRVRQRVLRMRYLEVFALVAVLLALNVGLMLAQTGYTKDAPHTVLDCHYNGNGAHTHNSDCYDASGTLVCPLEVRELHTHTEECYAEERTLVCGLEESEEHTHTDDCFEVTRKLVCGKEEVTEEHIHSAACFVTVVDDDQSDAADAYDGSEEASGGLTETGASDGVDANANANANATMPAQSFRELVTQEDGDGNERVIMTVVVEAPEGALPAGTSMRVELLDAADVEQTVADAVRRRDGEKARVDQITAVDITFYDAEGNEIEPASEVEVRITSDAVRDTDDPVLVQVDRQADDARVVEDATRVNRDDSDQSTGNEDTLSFSL